MAVNIDEKIAAYYRRTLGLCTRPHASFATVFSIIVLITVVNTHNVAVYPEQ